MHRPSTVTVYRDIRPMAGEPADLVAVDGVFAARVPDGAVAEVVDGRRRIAVPTLVDAHIHPDKTAFGEPWYSRRPAATLADHVHGDVELYEAQRTPVGERALRLLSHAAVSGTRAVRAHVDVAPAFGLDPLDGVAAAREALLGVLDVQIVAFPQHGVQRLPGVADLLEEAVRAGLADVVGGLDPAGFDGDRPGQLDTVFGLAERYGAAVDIHLHDTGEPGLGPLRDICARTRALGLAGRVTVSHAFCLAGLPEAELDAIASRLADAGVALTTAALGEATVLPFRELAERGVLVALGSDGVRDAWSPFGDADMLHRAHLLGRCIDARLDEELDACLALAAHGGAKLLGLPTVDFSPGSPADFMLLAGECVPQIVVDLPARAMVVRGGRIVARDGARNHVAAATSGVRP
ncbi:amidohydrolase [Yinghuangia sp. YIM S09857]|uniref:amidohydrolase n=1 Tax=Yinghuangia sp. YIM S09857 TaxID=3436929 RepID=UPI003F52B28E